MPVQVHHTVMNVCKRTENLKPRSLGQQFKFKPQRHWRIKKSEKAQSTYTVKIRVRYWGSECSKQPWHKEVRSINFQCNFTKHLKLGNNVSMLLKIQKWFTQLSLYCSLLHTHIYTYPIYTYNAQKCISVCYYGHHSSLISEVEVPHLTNSCIPFIVTDWSKVDSSTLKTQNVEWQGNVAWMNVTDF
jgi:hypothetical protein